MYQAARHVLACNIIHGDATTMRTDAGQPIAFAEWGYIGKGRFQRRDFRFDVLTGSSAFSAEGSLFAGLGKHEIFTPLRTYPPMTIGQLAAESGGELAAESGQLAAASGDGPTAASAASAGDAPDDRP